MPLNDRSHTLYRFFDEAGALLYIGITWNPMVRWYSHEDGKEWWLEARSSTFEHFPDRPTALAAEKAAIKSENPRYNIVHTGRHGKARSTIIQLPADLLEFTTGRFDLDGTKYVLQLRWAIVKGKLGVAGLRISTADLPACDNFPPIDGLGTPGKPLSPRVTRSGALNAEQNRGRREVLSRVKSRQTA